MLRRQPILGNPVAENCEYLHRFLRLGEYSLRLDTENPERDRTTKAPDVRILECLLVAGCRIDRLDSNGDTPFAVLLQGLLEKQGMLAR
jgi:hypothetical protein